MFYTDSCECCVRNKAPLLKRHLLLLIASGTCAAAGFGLAAQVASFVTPDHWCRDAYADALQEQLPLLPLHVRQFTVPARSNPAGLVYSQCHRFKGDTVGAYMQWVSNKKPPFSNSSNPEIPCDQGWHYNYTLSFESISTEMNWVCSDAWKSLFVHVLFCFSAALGVFFWSYIARRCGASRALLLALSAGAAGSGASLPPPASFVYVAVARGAAAFSQLAAPLLSLRLLVTDVLDHSGDLSSAASGTGRITMGTLLVQSASTVFATWCALFVSAWWLNVVTAGLFTLAAVLLCWQIIVSSRCNSGSAKNLKLPLQVVLDVHQQTHLHLFIYCVTLLASGAAYFGLLLLAPRLVNGPPMRSAALLSVAECVVLPLLLATTAPDPKVEQTHSTDEEALTSGDRFIIQRVIIFCTLSLSGLFLILLGFMKDTTFILTMALLARSSATVAFYGKRHLYESSVCASGLLTPGIATGESMVGLGATIAAALVLLEQETNSQFGFVILGIIIMVGAFSTMWIIARPLFRSFNYWWTRVRTSLKLSFTNCPCEGSAKFRNSNLPYGTLENL